MKILQICPPWIGIPPQTYGGTEWVIDNLTEELVAAGHDVTLFSTANTRTSAKLKYVYEAGLFEQNDAQWGLMQPALALPALVHYDQAFKEAATGQYDIVHAHLSAGTDIMNLKFLSEMQVPYLATTHLVFPFDRWSFKDEEFVKYYARQVKLVFISQTLSDSYPDNFDKLGVVHNGLNMKLHKFTAEPQGFAGEPYLTWIGKIMPWKGLDMAIQVAQATGIRLRFAGVLDEHNHPESRVYFDQKIRPHIDDDRIQFLGPADLKLKNELLGNAAAFLNPISWAEPFGMVSIESMACGTPVISFNSGGPTEIIEHGSTGFLTQTVEEMIDAVSRASQINRAACRHAIETRFSAKAMTDAYVNLYRTQIHQSGITDTPKPIAAIPAAIR
jgi:glycosyltransferase involved in cell wall biosynthesis